MNDTISAIATPKGVGAISIIRISGEKSGDILLRMSSLKKIPVPKQMKLAKIFDSDGSQIDEALVVYFKAPNSFTGEDMVEIHCHGGILVTELIFKRTLELGARVSARGEFTRRAFLNEKIDLLKAEAILQIIESPSEASLRIALDNLKGKLSNDITDIRKRIIDILSKIEVSLDYPEDVEADRNEFVQNLEVLDNYLKEKVSDARDGIHLATGVTLSIVGKPNTGKSTLLNRLLKEDRAIVTDIPGTTRDVIQGYIKIKDIQFKISDTAGIRQTEDLVEKIGIERSINEAKKSDIVIFLLDSESGFTQEDQMIYELIKDTNHIVVWNKVDIGTNIGKISQEDVKLSAKEGTGLKDLETKLLEKSKKILEHGEASHIMSARQLESLERIQMFVNNARNSLLQNYPVEIISIDLRNALDETDKLLGRSFTEDLLDNIFSNFCVGK